MFVKVQLKLEFSQDEKLLNMHKKGPTIRDWKRVRHKSGNT